MTPLLALHTGAFNRNIRKFTTFFSQSLHCAFRKRTYLINALMQKSTHIARLSPSVTNPTKAPYKGLDQTEALSAIEEKMAE